MGLAVLLVAGCDAPSGRDHAVGDHAMKDTLTGEKPIVIAHRGASGYLPEHTLAAYDMAINMGADFIEPDLVLTKDGHLIARHDYFLGTTTDVADRPEFADHRKIRDGYEGGEWFVEDFTLAEIKTLKARQPFPGRSADHDGLYEVPTFAEVLALAERRSVELGRPIGVYPETKHPAHFKAMELDFVPPLLSALDGFTQPVFIQSFEPDILRELKPKTDHPLIMLVFPTQDGSPNVSLSVPLDVAAEFADGVGPYKELLRDPETGAPSDFVARAHALGLKVHPWTFRDDQVGEGFETIDAEMTFYLDQGIDGLFSDFTDTAVSVRNAR